MFAKTTSHNGIQLTLVGTWQELAAYYEGDDGNYWVYAGRGFSNCGPQIRNARGTALDGRKITELPNLSGDQK